MGPPVGAGYLAATPSDTRSPVRLPVPLLFVCVGLVVAAPAVAGPAAPSFTVQRLPTNLSARPEHVPKPLPEDGSLEFQRTGPGGWAVASGFFLGAAATAAVVSGVEHARMKRAEEPSVADNARRVRNASGYTAIGLAGASGVCLVLNQVW
jgi:hypothetical protein